MLNPNLIVPVQKETGKMRILKLAVFVTVIFTVLLITASVCKSEDNKTICGMSEHRIKSYQERIMPLIPMIKDILSEYNLDENFIWLAMLESGGKPQNESDKGAVGLWQLTAPTARSNGCPSNKRTDPECSTRAAAHYLTKLLKKFNGNVWDAIVGYNMGGSNYKKKGKPTGEARYLANRVTCLMREMPLNTWYGEQ